MCCQIFDNSTFRVVQMYNQYHQEPILLDKNDPSVGISDQSIQFKDGKVSCSFRRQKFIDRELSIYFDMSEEYYVLMAFGKLQNGSIFFMKIQYMLNKIIHLRYNALS